jgi:putative Ca2+/H+ antiporter (TMEM165/GDT1 family)
VKSSVSSQRTPTIHLTINHPTNDLAPDLTPDLAESTSLASSLTADPETASLASQPQSDWKTSLKVFTSTFLTIFLAELGDKTQLTTLLMSAESQSPWTVFIGAGLALVLTSLIGILVGCWLSKRVPPQTLEKASGIMLLFISIALVWDIVQG